MKKYSSILFFLLFINLGFSQNRTIDSLRLSLENTSIVDTTRINVYVHLTKQFMSISLDSFSKYVDISMQLSLKRGFHKLPRIYSNKGLSYVYKSKNDSARFYFDKSLNLLNKSNNKEIRAIVYGNYAMSYQDNSDFENMAKYNLKAIEMSEGNDTELCRLYFNQGIIFGHSEFMSKAKKYFKLAFNTSNKVKNDRFEAMSAKGLGHVYITENKLDSAKIYLDRSVVLCEKTNNPQICYEANSKIGELYDLLNKPKMAEASFKKALKYAKIRNRDYELMAINIFLGQHELKKNNFAKAVVYFENFDEFYMNSPQSTLRVEALRSWSKSEEGLGNYKKSNLLLEEYLQIKDSIFSAENRQSLVNSEAKYQTEKKDKEIVEQQLELSQNKTQFSYMAGGALLVVVSSILLWFLYQQRQKRQNQEILTLKREHQVQTLESLMEGEEKERFRIAKELHDGVNGDLAAIKFKLSSLLEMNNTVIKEAVSMIDKSCQQVRAISHNLVPPSLQDFNLIEALEEYCTNMNAIHNPKISFQQLGNTIKLTKKQEANVFRIVQELVNNSIKHAEADEINVQISSRENSIQLTVEDNGKGYDKKTIKTDGIGLKNIESRVDYLNASLDVVSNKKGTSTIVEIEINKPNEN